MTKSKKVPVIPMMLADNMSTSGCARLTSLPAQNPRGVKSAILNTLTGEETEGEVEIQLISPPSFITRKNWPQKGILSDPTAQPTG